MNLTFLMSQIRTELERHHSGRGQAITAGQLAAMFGYDDDRIIRKAIEELIDEDLPVVAATESPAGYFIPVSLQEAREYTKSLQSRAVHVFLRRRRVIRNTERYLAEAKQGELIPKKDC